MANGVADAGVEQQQADRHQVHRAHQRFPHARRAIKPAAVVDRPPDGLELRRVDHDRRIEHDGRRRIAVLERRRVNKWFERGAGLTKRLAGAIELAQREIESAGQRINSAIVRVDGNDCSLRFRYLGECPRPAGGGHDVNEVAHSEHVRRALGRGTGRVPIDKRFCPANPGPRQRRRSATGENDACRVIVVDGGNQRDRQAARRVLLECFANVERPVFKRLRQ